MLKCAHGDHMATIARTNLYGNDVYLCQSMECYTKEIELDDVRRRWLEDTQRVDDMVAKAGAILNK